MKYLHKDANGTICFDSYFSYIESIKDKLAPHVYSFASDFRFYGLQDHSSLHDAWLDYLNIAEPAKGERRELRGIEIEAKFLGPFHDRYIFLRYLNVVAFELRTPESLGHFPSERTGHGDLLLHELRLEDNSILVHEIEFSRGSVFVIKCRDLVHREVGRANA